MRHKEHKQVNLDGIRWLIETERKAAAYDRLIGWLNKQDEETNNEMAWFPDLERRSEIRKILEGPPETSANARLIAAAPDLLEACRIIVHDSLLHGCLTMTTIDRVKDVIVKAGGR